MSNKDGEFVCIFVFDSSMRNVILVRKSKGPTPDNPNGQIGKLNGMGGKVEFEDGSLRNTCIRELKEETKLDFLHDELIYFRKEMYHNQGAIGAIVHYYYVQNSTHYNNLVHLGQTTDGDEIIEQSLHDLGDIVYYNTERKFVWNVPYLLVMASVLSHADSRNWPTI